MNRAIPRAFTRDRACLRRGVLLLVVLSMLTLFMMLGAAYVVTATRAREAARAYARLTFGGDEARVPHAPMLDAVLMKVVAGGSNALKQTGYPPGLLRFESLLADKYGAATVSGTATGVSRSGPVLTAAVTFATPLRPSDLNGRVLTFLEPGRAATSHRIVRAANAAADNAAVAALTLRLDLPVNIEPFSLPATPARVIVNGREFAGVAPGNEGWDGYDFANNPYLAQVRSSTTSVSSSEVLRGSYIDTGSNGRFGTYSFSPAAGGTVLNPGMDLTGDQIPDVADNDNDGVADGLFLDFGLPSVTDGYGNTVQLSASVLVLPLDGRFNVNAHGSLSPILYSGTHDNWPSAPNVRGSFTAVPMGSGYGPADIQANLGFRSEPKTSAALLNSGSSPPRLFDRGTLATGENPRAILTIGVGANAQVGRRPTGSRYTSGTTTPRLRALEARYGEQAAPSTATPGDDIQLDEADFPFARPGRPDVDDEASRMTDRRAPSVAGVQVNYGIPSLWWTGSNSFDWAQATATTPLPRGVFNSPPDLHGRMKTLTLSATTSGASAIAPAVAFAQPEWSGPNTPRETRDDPYELRLDTRRGAGGLLFDPTAGGSGTSASSVLRDNPFTAAELEPVLRPYDIDTNRLPVRLAAMLGSAAEESRLRITTDSWDTTAITGSAALVIFGTQGGADGWLQNDSLAITGSTTLAGAVGGEVARGERFDLNRALGPPGATNADLQRQAYFKDLYTLAVMLSSTNGTAIVSTGTGRLSGTAATAVLAQWAANVVEFRDADSRVLPFEYDVNPANGWQVDGVVTTNDRGTERAVVWGAERPEILIAETLAWENLDSGTTGGLFVALHRPWNAKAYGSGSASIIDAEPCDVALDTLSGGNTGRPTNVVDLGRKPNADYNSGDPAVYPIWRLRIVGSSTSGTSTAYVRFDTGTNSSDYGVDGVASTSAAGNGNSKPKLAPDSTISLRGGDVIRWATLTGSGTVTMTVSGSSCLMSGSAGPLRVPRAASDPPARTRRAVLYLERLADPSQAADQATWYADPLLNLDDATKTQRYIVVDSSTLTVFNTGTTLGGPSVDVRTSGRAGAVANPAPGSAGTLWWRSLFVTGTTIPLAPGGTGRFPNLATGSDAVAGIAWLPWPNRPFVSAAELLLVPRGNAVEMLRDYQRPSAANQATVGVPVPLHLLFDAVHVPTRFSGIHTTSLNTGPAQTGIDANVTTVNQFSSFREPGRVNLNVVASDDVWNAVVAGPLPGPVATGTGARLSLTAAGDWNPAPATSMLGILALKATGTTVVSDTTTTVSGSNTAMPTSVLAWDKNPLHEFYTATRLANTATPRSNVFGVWITLRESVANDPDSVRFTRAFYIVDRSIPVGFEPDQVGNAWDCVRLRRIIE